MPSKRNGVSGSKDFRTILKIDANSFAPDIKRLFKKEVKRKSLEYNRIGKLSTAQYFYKYINLENALKCISNGNLLFSEPSRWQDNYERRFYEADYSSQNIDEATDCPMLFATCMTTKRFNEAAWVLYTYRKTGLGAFCVEFQLNKQKLRLQLVKALKKNDRIYEGTVMYMSPFVIDNMHRKEIDNDNNPNYLKYVNKRSGIPYLTNYLNLLLMKRDAFQHENETRFYIAKDSMKGESKSQQDKTDEKVFGQVHLIDIDWIEIIEKVYVNAKDDSDEYKLLSEALKTKLDEKFKGISDPVLIYEKDSIWNKRLKPIPFFVYGEPLAKRLIIE